MSRYGIGSVTRIGVVVLTGILALAFLGLTGCGSTSYESDTAMWSEPSDGSRDIGMPGTLADEGVSSSMPSPDGEMPPTGSGRDAADVPADERYVIRTLGMRVQVDDVESAVDSLREQTELAGGIVTGLQVSTDDETPVYRYEAFGSLADGAPLMGYVTVRVPADGLPAFLDAIADLGDVVRQSSDESDVTQEHIDLSARLGNLRSQEARLREFFDRAENVEEMLEVERELGRVRGEIESLTARIAYLERQSAMATVTIELIGDQPIIRPAGSDWGFVRAITTGVRGFVGTINAMIILAMSALPLVFIGIVTWLIIRTAIRRRRASRSIDDREPFDGGAPAADPHQPTDRAPEA